MNYEARIKELEHHLEIMIFRAEDFAEQLQNACEGFEDEEEFPLSEEIEEFEVLAQKAKNVLNKKGVK